jgi:uncharacterized protein
VELIRRMMVLLAWASGLLLAGCSDAGSDLAPAGSAARPALFAIVADDAADDAADDSAENAAPVGWLFGTIHALPDGTRWRTPQMVAVIAEADYLLVEVAGLDDGDLVPRTFRQLATSPGLPLIEQRVAARHRPRLAELLRTAGLSPLQQRQTETWATALMLAQMTSEGDPANGVDRALIRSFSGRPLRELEGARGQLSVFDALPDAAQVALLEAVIAASIDPSADAARLREAWLRGDLAAIAAASDTGVLADPRLRQALLIDRNQRWLPQLERALASRERPLIAVGAAHLVGPDGLIALLEARGFRLIRIS